jgi:hypothetical protein
MTTRTWMNGDLIIVENIYNDEVKDFPMLSEYFHVLYLMSMYYEH